MLAVPYEREVMGPFFQSWTHTLLNPFARWRPFLVGGTVVHLARDTIVRAALADTEVTHLVMVDSDQVFNPWIVERLVNWNVPVVAPVIVQRNGDAIPVAYREVGQDAQGYYRYDPELMEIAAYFSQFRPERLEQPTCLLPLVADHAPVMAGVPDDVRDGLDHPLWPVDALGTGMVCIRRDVLEAVEPDPKNGLYFGFKEGGEDFDFMRRIRRAGWGGKDQGTRGQGIFVDRGAVVGHMISYARGAGDLMQTVLAQDIERRQREAADAALPPAVPDLVNALANGRTEGHEPDWMRVQLPGEAAA